jgi:hypothetical protein
VAKKVVPRYTLYPVTQHYVAAVQVKFVVVEVVPDAAKLLCADGATVSAVPA